MSSTLSVARGLSTDPWPADTSPDATLRPAELKPERKRDAFARKRPSLGRRALRFLITLGLGVGATLAWQSYGDVARQMLAESSPQLAWLAPQAAPQGASQAASQAASLAPAVAETQPAPQPAAPPAPPSVDPQQLNAISLDLASVRQSVDQLTARQQQMAGDIARLQASEHDILQKVSAPPPRPAAPPVRKPVPPTLAPSALAPPVR
jgi:hypothetical protein